MKVLVVGGVAGGASAAARIRRLDSHAEIIIFERGQHVSFSNCCLPYYLSGEIEDSEDLIMMDPDDFQLRYGIDARVNSEVVQILREEKTVLVQESTTGREYRESYDKLVLAPGAKPILPKGIRGIDNRNVFSVRNVTDICALKSYIDENDVNEIAVVGGGFVGIEIAENFRKAGKNVAVIEGTDQILAPYDYDMVQTLHKELMDNDVDLYVSRFVTGITDRGVITERDGKVLEIPADAVVFAVGVQPETKLAADAGLIIGETGRIKVNHNYQTSDPAIYAVGDAVEIFDRMARRYGGLALAGPAQRQARAAADHICGQYHTNKGYIGSACLRVFRMNAACTGMNEKAILRANIPYDVAYVIPSDKVSIMPDSDYMTCKLLFEVPTGRILGAQAIGSGDVVERINVIATMITMNGTLADLKELELCYSPVFGTAKDVVNMAALVGLNLLHDRIQQVRVSEVRELVESGAYIIDVREEREYARGHIQNAVNIPLSQFRARMHEVPTDIPVYVHCRTSQRSYYALCELIGNGYTNVKNISGSFLGLCLYEYYNDQREQRTPIVTKYNFN